MKKIFVLSKISLALSLCYINASYADIQSANNNTQINHKQGVEIVNIATPSQSGLSHNQYNKYNVDRSGAVLNNAKQTVNTQLAGSVSANPNLKNNAATVILNEVVSRTPSVLAGKQEIAGQRADYVLANPNGISCDGCGFINTPRASLVVGNPNVQQGKLTGYNIQGEKSLTTNGNIQAQDLDFLAPTVNINGNVEAQNLNVLLGKNEVQRDNDGHLTAHIQKQGRILDGKIAGSIQAGRIRIHSTDQHATLNISGSQLKGKDIILTAGNTKIDGIIKSEQKSTSHQGKSRNNFKTNENTATTQESYKKTQLTADNLLLAANNKLDITGADIQAKTTTLAGGSTNFGIQKTTDSKHHTLESKKGLQYKNEMQNDSKETVHRTQIKSDNLKISAAEGKITGQAVKLDAKNIGFYAKQGIELSGAIENHKHSETVSQAGVARAKKSSSEQRVREQKYISSEINSQSDVVIGSEKYIRLAGVKSKINGSLIVKSGANTDFLSENTNNQNLAEGKEKIVGGLFGGKESLSSNINQLQTRSDFTVGGKILIDSHDGVHISGSRVVATQEGKIKTNGNLVVDAVQVTQTTQNNSRKGTIFNITKSRQEQYRHTSTAQGSQLKSESNLVVSTNNLDVIGSSINAAGLLDIAALSHINVKGATNSELQKQLDAGFGWTAKVEKPTINLDKKGFFNTTLNEVKKLINGETEPAKSVSALANYVKDNIKFDVKANVGLNFHRDQKTNHNITHSAAQLSGGNTNITAKDVNLKGSQITANNGNLNINAQNVNSSAQHNQQNENQHNTSGGINNQIHLTQDGVTNTFSIGVNHANSQNNAKIAQSSQLSAKQDLNIQANNILHQGSKLSAGNNLVENAGKIQHSVTNDQHINNSQNVNVGVSLTTGIDKSKVLNGKLSLQAEGGHERLTQNDAKATQLNAGNHIIVSANNLQDKGTSYQAGQNVTLNSQQHNLQAAQNTTHKDSVKAGVNLEISANSKDLNTVNADVSLGVNFQKNSSNTTTAQKGNVQGNNINIKTGTLTSQSDINAAQNVRIDAEKAHFNQAQNTENSIGGGFAANLGLGALVIPSAGAAIPSVDVKLDVNGGRKANLESVSPNIVGNNVQISAKKEVVLQGTNTTGKQELNISGQKITYSASNNQRKGVDVSISTGVGLSSDLSNVNINGKLAVKHENSHTHQESSVNGNNVTLQSKDGINLNGVSVNSKTLKLDSGTGDLSLTSAQGKVNKTDFSTSLSLSGGVKDQVLVPSSGSANLDLGIVRNQSQTSTTLTSQNANLNVGNNMRLEGSSLTADQITGTVKGDLHKQDVSNKINEVNVNISASGKGKPLPYTSDNWSENIKKDWDNGTIAGVSAGVNIGATSNRVNKNSLAAIKSKYNKLLVKGRVNTAPAPAQFKKGVTLKVDANTNIRQTWKERKQVFYFSKR